MTIIKKGKGSRKTIEPQNTITVTTNKERNKNKQTNIATNEEHNNITNTSTNKIVPQV